MKIVFILITICLLVASMLFAMCISVCLHEDIEDEEQMEFLRRYREEKERGSAESEETDR